MISRAATLRGERGGSDGDADERQVRERVERDEVADAGEDGHVERSAREARRGDAPEREREVDPCAPRRFLVTSRRAA
jgi:hypothetical protein